ncbi:MAG: glycosyltransferase family 2 protein [Proteobacteria bacterium]|nr:glycosyltransferase family 2 protein [Pseudomonadota bacterium]
MRVAVVIAARDVAPYIAVAVQSVLAQTHQDLSLTVVDDGSRDDTAAIAAGFPDNRLSLFRETGIGVAGGRNRGVMEADPADAFLFLDGDDWLAPDALARLVGALEATPAAVAAHGPFAYVRMEARPDEPGPLDCRLASSAGDLLARLMRGNLFANGGHVLVRAEAWERSGPFRPDLLFAEDWEYWLRLALQGPFVGIGGRPVLFVRRRTGSIMHGGATRAESYRPVLAAIAANEALGARFGAPRFAALLRRTEQELAWTMGREFLRRGKPASAWPLLRRGLWGRPRPQRLALLALAGFRAARAPA